MLLHLAKMENQCTVLLARLCVATSFILLALPVAVAGGSIHFNFPPTTDLEIEGDTSFERNNFIQLTPDRKTTSGWVAYNKSIPLWDDTYEGLANFTTHFRFMINGSGDGFAFFLVPHDFHLPKQNAVQWFGSGFGVFNFTDYPRSAIPIVAVEFDTYKNSLWDPDDNHVGIDVNSFVSEVYFSLSNSSYPAQDLKNGKNWDVWVDYDGSAKQLRVFLLYNPNLTNFSKPVTPILQHDIDLRRALLTKNVKVGLSAATGSSVGNQTVSFWSFSSHYSWEISAESNPISGSSPKKRHISSLKVILISVCACFLGACALIFLGRRWYANSRSKRRGEESEGSNVALEDGFVHGPRKFSYHELLHATKNFSNDEKLGEGGFGGVYRGILPRTKEIVSVKRVSQRSKQGKKEYVSEISIISRLRHRNLVQLLGWCREKGELLLVYEFLPNLSLDKYIFKEERGHLGWEQRYNIAGDIASALVYLHEDWEQSVVHRDVKASNVMLDSDFNAKLGDFGLARLVDSDRATSHTTVVAGTLGYLAPECVITGKASPESDVFSFGAVTLEIACGRRPIDQSLNDERCRLVEWVWNLYEEGKLLNAVDEKLCGDFDAEQMERLMVVGLLCSHPDPQARPTMRQVIKFLKFEAPLPYVPQKLPVALYTVEVYTDSFGRQVTSSPQSSVYTASTSTLVPR